MNKIFKATVVTLAIGSTTMLVTVFGGIGYVCWRVGSYPNEVAQGMDSLAKEFSVGKPSANFIAKARSINADQYSVQPASMQPDKWQTPAAASLEWNISRLESSLNGDKDYEERLNELDSNFRKLTDGSAKIQVTASAPFLRDYCQITFKDGKVTSVKLSQLD